MILLARTEKESNDKILLYDISLLYAKSYFDKVYEIVVYFACQRQYFAVIISCFTFSNV